MSSDMSPSWACERVSTLMQRRTVVVYGAWSGLLWRWLWFAASTSAHRRCRDPCLASRPRRLLSADSITLGSSPLARTNWRGRWKRRASPISASRWTSTVRLQLARDPAPAGRRLDRDRRQLPLPLHRPVSEPLTRRLEPPFAQLTRVRIEHHRLKHRLVNIESAYNICRGLPS
jgi:hypothetical protein